MAGPDLEFWQQRFEQGSTPWDRGAANPQLQVWLREGSLSPCRILVPGCGNGHEVLALAAAGFDVTALDYAPAAVEGVRRRLGQAGLKATLIQADVRSWSPQTRFDAIYEQTCLCALHPDDWSIYAARLRDWLAPHGRLYALFMQAPKPGAAEGLIQGPPYHCDIHGMRALFPASQWRWPAPPYPRVDHPSGTHEIGVVLQAEPRREPGSADIVELSRRLP
ncbi:MAG: thiopurine S-methyltransferase [Thiomonas sp. 13-66-29]|jgi:SAM-dependent methyltransferase|uniref:methyltransferase domain-containing protein n=1 Tax=Thiomonas sp. TaxID=2047785 RepID=UPI000BD0BCF0|nr:methyltransferase domain-containing protein [Thiomonas sp.]OZB58770.1 MAG: thiopurine S-methyltransferase [Thiomonas sp. 13-66-29]